MQNKGVIYILTNPSFPEYVKIGYADIVIFNDNKDRSQENIKIIVECKRKNRKDGIEQLKTYLAGCQSAEYGIWFNGNDITYIKRLTKSPHWKEVYNIPRKGEDLGLPQKSSLQAATELVKVFETCHNYIYANDGQLKDKVFNEILKILFIKIMDERDFTSKIAKFGITEKEYDAFISNLYVFLGGLYKKYKLVMQLHLAVKRNASTKLFEKLGRDVGGDCVGNPIKASSITALLDKMEMEDKLPDTIVYTLNPTVYYEIATGIRSFRNVSLGAAWWFCDNLSGIKKQIMSLANLGILGNFVGMLTDSRSFLSYARHDYFRRILSSALGKAVENGEFAPAESAVNIAEKICYYNIKDKLEE